MIEVEIKAIIKDPNILRRNFDKNKGVYKISLEHEDTYFNMPEELRNFKETDEALRLRKSVEYKKDDKTGDSNINYYITYKGKKIDSTTKTREEIEVKISDIEDTNKLLKLLGFREIFTVRKERELYEFIFRNKKIEAFTDEI